MACINVAANTIAGGYSVAASARGAAPTNFNLTNTAGMATKLAFFQQPTDTNYGDTISPAVTVEVVDQYNNPVDSDGIHHRRARQQSDGSSRSAERSCSPPSPAVATFSDLTVSKVGAGYTSRQRLPVSARPHHQIRSTSLRGRSR